MAYQAVWKIGKKVLSPAELAQLVSPARQPRRYLTSTAAAYTIFDNLLATEVLADFKRYAEISSSAATRQEIEVYEQADLAQAGGHRHEGAWGPPKIWTHPR